MMIYKPYDVVEVPFPFSDLPKAKKRKALVISTEEFNRSNNCSVLMMITSASYSEWLYDVPIKNWSETGLKKPCVARMKIFTLDNNLIISKVGKLTSEDKTEVSVALKHSLCIGL